MPSHSQSATPQAAATASFSAGGDFPAPVEPVRIPARLIEFLLARITEDEASASALLRHAGQAARAGAVRDSTAEVAVQDARAVQQACAAKRTRIGRLQLDLLFRDRPEDAATRADALAQLSQMLTPYHTHPAYRAEWASVLTSC